MLYLISNQLNIYNNSEFTYISLSEAIIQLKSYSELGLDTETKGLDVFTKSLLLLQIGNFENQFVFDISSFNCKIPYELIEFLNNTDCLFIIQNAKFDWKFLFHQGVVIKNVFDTMLAEIILTNGLQYKGRDLASIAYKYCGVTLNKEVRGEIITKGLSDRVIKYGADDVKYLPKIKEKQLEEAEKLDLINSINLDNSFVIVLAYVEYCGIKLDYAKWEIKTKKNIEKARELKQVLEGKLWEDKKYKYFSGMQDMYTGAYDCILNWDSPKQVMALFKEYGINVIMKTKGENKETIDAKVLEPQIGKFSIIKPYLNYKEAQKEVSTYGFNWKDYINPVTGRIHTNFNQLMDTGRLSSGNKDEKKPNLQNIPSDQETRSCFVCEKGNVLIDNDYSSQESVVLANFSKEPNLIKFYQKGLSDSHSYVAFLMYPHIRTCSLEDINTEALDYIKVHHKEKRQNAKAANFAIAYGGNGATIAKNCNISKAEGEFVYNSYFTAFPEMKKYFDIGFKKASYYGYVEFNSVTKRKYFFNKEENDYFRLREEVEDPYFWVSSPNPREIEGKYKKAKSEVQRISQNYSIQGSSADITKYACILFFKEILKNNWLNIVKIVNLIHDEILIECPEHLREAAQELSINAMERAGEPFCRIIPLKAGTIYGDHWVH